MKCRECSNCYKGYWASAPEAYICVDVKEPFEIIDINVECIKHQYEPEKCSHWEISFDGYYPYCAECGYRPGRGKLADHCPECGSRMDGDTIEK